MITRIEVIKVTPQAFKGEKVEGLISDPWKVFNCEPNQQGCEVEFSDDEFNSASRDASYYVRAIQEPSPAVNAGSLRCTYDDLGAAAKVEERKIGESDMTFITGCPEAKSVSVLLRGGTEHVVDEIRRAFDDAVGVVSVAWEDGAVLTGGGSVLAALSRELRSYAESVGGREQMAIEAFASALEIIPRTLAENAGLDPVNTIIELRKAHADGKGYSGINVEDGVDLDWFWRGWFFTNDHVDLSIEEVEWFQLELDPTKKRAAEKKDKEKNKISG